MTDHPTDSAALRLALEGVRLFPDQPDQLVEVDRLRAIYSHTITGVYLEKPAIPFREFTCFAFTFGLMTWPRYARTLTHPVRPVISQAFLSDVLSESIEVRAQDATDGTVAIYRVDDAIVHSGLVRDGRIRSKWGNGYLWDHGAFEVPLEYGSALHYFKVPGVARVVRILGRHAAQQRASAERRFQMLIERMRAHVGPLTD